MPLSVGDKLGHYEVLSLLGVGGMGEVYRAKDSKLDRQVAIKVLPSALARDPERLARFEREAKVLASLDHANVGHIYGIVDSADSHGLVLALIEGPTLEDRIAAGPIPLEEAIAISKQIIEALEYAHDRGVVHRDLKPANVKITPEGVVKVLDFGLAKVLEDEPPPSSPSNSPTLTLGHTRNGVILGTAAYMSPEQAVGRPVDRRSDIFSFGAVLYEMLTGKRAFIGATTPDVLEAVVKTDPDWSALAAGTPTYLRRLLERTLAKDRKERLQAIGEARIVLAKPQSDELASAAGATTLSASRSGRLPWILAAGMLAVVALGVSLVHFRETASALPPGRFGITLPGNQPRDLKLSPDGRNLAFVVANQPRIWVRPLDSLEARQVPGTEGALFPFWSYDGENLGFFAQGKLKKIALAGGPAQTLCDAPTGRGGSWNREGIIVFAPDIGGSLYRVSADGGVPTQLTKQGRYPEFIQGGSRFLFESDAGTESPGIFVGSLDGTAPVRILPDVSRGIYVPPPVGGGMGHLLFRREGTLMALPFDPEELVARGGAVPLTENVPDSFTVGYGGFAASENGVLLYVSGNAASNTTLTWLDRTGKRLESKSAVRPYSGTTLAPDGKRAAVVVGAGLEASDVWLQDLERGVPTRFTFKGFSVSPVWSPDGDFIVFERSSRLGSDLYRKPSNGGGAEELLLHGGPNAGPADISPDGKWLVYSETNGKSKNDLWLLPLTGEHKPVKYLNSPFSERHAQFSPDGKWMAYTSDDSGQDQVYVQPIPATGAKRQVSTSGGSRSRWRRDGKELFYISAESKLMAVPASLGPSGFDFGAPQQLFDRTLPLFGFAFNYQPTADGQKFLAILPEEGAAAAASSVTVQMNWQAGLKK